MCVLQCTNETDRSPIPRAPNVTNHGRYSFYCASSSSSNSTPNSTRILSPSLLRWKLQFSPGTRSPSPIPKRHSHAAGPAHRPGRDISRISVGSHAGSVSGPFLHLRPRHSRVLLQVLVRDGFFFMAPALFGIFVASADRVSGGMARAFTLVVLDLGRGLGTHL